MSEAMPPSQKIQGLFRAHLVRDLTVGDMSTEQLGEKYDFACENRAEIAEVWRQMGAELARVWVARKATRIAEYQQTYEEIRAQKEPLEEAADAQGNLVSAARWRQLIDRQLCILRAVADEMGRLLSRAPGEGYACHAAPCGGGSRP